MLTALLRYNCSNWHRLALCFYTSCFFFFFFFLLRRGRRRRLLRRIVINGGKFNDRYLFRKFLDRRDRGLHHRVRLVFINSSARSQLHHRSFDCLQHNWQHLHFACFLPRPKVTDSAQLLHSQLGGHWFDSGFHQRTVLRRVYATQVLLAVWLPILQNMVRGGFLDLRGIGVDDCSHQPGPISLGE